MPKTNTQENKLSTRISIPESATPGNPSLATKPEENNAKYTIPKKKVIKLNDQLAQDNEVSKMFYQSEEFAISQKRASPPKEYQVQAVPIKRAVPEAINQVTLEKRRNYIPVEELRRYEVSSQQNNNNTQRYQPYEKKISPPKNINNNGRYGQVDTFKQNDFQNQKVLVNNNRDPVPVKPNSEMNFAVNIGSWYEIEKIKYVSHYRMPNSSLGLNKFIPVLPRALINI